MDQKAPLEITKLDVQIAQACGTTSGIDMLPSRLQKTKRNPLAPSYVEDLVSQNGYLREEIIFHKESKNAMLAFHSEALASFSILEPALKNLSEKLLASEGRLLEYWGIKLTSLDKDDLTVL